MQQERSHGATAVSRTRAAADTGHPELASRVIAEVEAELHHRGPLAALACLNERTHFRFSGIYRVEPPILRNIFLFDRENPALNVSGGTSILDETYCALVSRRAASFATDDASRDARLRDHAARESVISYAGVPLRDTGGRAWGTLCHFDVRPRLLPDPELAVLDAAASVFMCWVREHELPAATPRRPDA